MAGLPPAKNGPSVLSIAHPHHQRVIDLLRAVAAQLPDGFVPLRGAVSVTLTLHAPTSTPRGDPTNFLGGIADVLQRKRGVDSLGELANVVVYENDLQLRRINFTQATSSDVSYELTITDLGGPDLVGPRVSAIHGVQISVEITEVDEIALELVNVLEQRGRYAVRASDALSLLNWLELRHVVPEPILGEVRPLVAGSARASDELVLEARTLSAGLCRLFAGQRAAEDAQLLTRMRREAAAYEVVDLDATDDLALANLAITADKPTCVLAPIVRSAIRLLLPSVRGRIRVCADPTCRAFFVDKSKNGTKIWCEMATCGSRAKQRAWRERQSRLGESPASYVVM